MKRLFSVLRDLVGIAFGGKSYLMQSYTKKELAEMGVTLN